ncbi:adenylyl-sulfate kinase [Chengkuizengella sediminis]|uniref:adenylyl-sulfate kinase n=1 Tax=Chengkuizengella sediminis TaxID=1885917 RepID=UPI001F0DBEAC|nr:adenylyl-sulfate kinase [Chengkuizengella sediminis]
MLLDDDNVRHGLNKNLGIKESNRVENIRRIDEVSKLKNNAGIITLIALISPYDSDRKNAREIIGEEYIEIFVNLLIAISLGKIRHLELGSSGHTDNENRISEFEFNCTKCGYVAYADYNASLNIKEKSFRQLVKRRSDD